MPADVPIKTLRDILSLDEKTGLLTWLKRTPDMFQDKHISAVSICNRWNSKWAGMPALNSPNPKGYFGGSIFSEKHLAARVIFAMHTGRWPVGEVDHINGNRKDNRPANLRDVTRSENRRNQCIPSHNTSGHIGVTWHKRSKKWMSQIKESGTNHCLGYYDNIKDAIAARAAAEVVHGFHKNHGRVNQNDEKNRNSKCADRRNHNRQLERATV